MKILFITPYSFNSAPSQRFRFEQYFQLLSTLGHDFTLAPFQSRQNWQVFYQPGRTVKKIALLAAGTARRLALLRTAHRFTHVFIHREALPFGPPWIEWLIAKLWRKKIIYDFDDAIWMTDKATENWFERTLKWRSKVGCICRWSYRVSCGNRYLAAYAGQFNRHVVVNPTTIDTENLHQLALLPARAAGSDRITIGWTGSRTTLKYLRPFLPVFSQLRQRFPTLRLLVIADQNPHFEDPAVEFRTWRLETEISDLAEIDIGIMPLPDDGWTKGKCGFKGLQYMALGIPTVMSPVGVNTEMVEHGYHGFLAGDTEQWLQLLARLIEQPGLRAEMGERGRSLVARRYSVKSNTENFMRLFG